MEKKYNQPVYPTKDRTYKGSGEWEEREMIPGMLLIDKVSIAAMQGITIAQPHWAKETIIKESWEYAKEWMEEREKYVK